MSDKRDPDGPQYDWLYSGQRRKPHDVDPDETRMIPRQQGDDDTEATGPVSDASEHTAVLDVTPPGAAAGPPSAASGNPPSFGSAPPPADERAANRPASFGGTYAAPQAGSRYASPSPQPPSGHGPPQQPPGASRQPPPRAPRRRSRRRWWLRGILILVLAWVVFLVAVPIWTLQSITKVDADPGGNRPADTPGTTYLLVGSDSRAGLSQQQRQGLGTGQAAGQRTDTIIMLHVPDGSGPTLLLSIPRDSYVDIPGHSKGKINAAYAYGGADLLVQTVEQATNVHIDDYIEVGFTAFVDIVDAVGGIQVCPRTSINDPKAGNLKLQKGCQEVDGTTALGYSRSRAFPLGDITRAEHQREVISAVGKKAASWQTIVLPWRYLQVNRAAADTLQVGDNVGPIDLAKFAWAMAHTSGADAKRCVVPYSDLGASTPAGTAVIWDQAKADAVFKAIRDDNTASATCSATGQ